MNDRQWDDWIRAQPGTFWGEEKRRLSQSLTPATSYAPSTRASRPQQPKLPPPLVQGKVKTYQGGKFLFMRHRQGVAEHCDGMIYEGRWFLGDWGGEGVLTLPNVWVYRGRFAAGMLHGKGTLTLQNGLTFEGRFRKSVPVGKGVVTFPGGSRFEGKWYGTGEARGKYHDADNQMSKAFIENGELKTKNGFFSRARTQQHLCFREILNGQF